MARMAERPPRHHHRLAPLLHLPPGRSDSVYRPRLLRGRLLGRCGRGAPGPPLRRRGPQRAIPRDGPPAPGPRAGPPVRQPVRGGLNVISDHISPDDVRNLYRTEPSSGEDYARAVEIITHSLREWFGNVITARGDFAAVLLARLLRDELKLMVVRQQHVRYRGD